MKPGEDFRPDTDQPVAAGGAGRELVPREVRETGGQVLWAVWKLFLVLLAAALGAASVEAVRAIF